MIPDPDHFKLDFESINLSESDDVYADSAKNDPEYSSPRHKRVSAGVKRNVIDL